MVSDAVVRCVVVSDAVPRCVVVMAVKVVVVSDFKLWLVMLCFVMFYLVSCVVNNVFSDVIFNNVVH